ncbi:MAG: photosynthetic reaction center cytochrome c subunit [Acidobacteria bacterium]|nr:photosynthetic reaction center cytochrome c subunit [Acidobacteriota bacterium]
MIPQRIVKWFILVVIVAAVIFHHSAQAHQQPAPAEPKNLQVFSGLSRPQVMQVMGDWVTALGVDCSYCHQASFEAETPRKQIARQMQREYVAALRHSDGSAIRCQDCHQGRANMLSVQASAYGKSSAGNPALRALRVKLKSAGVVLWRASTKVRFLPKDRFMERMLSFNQALGVNCSYCHKKGDYESETPHKQTARLMMKEFSAKLTKPDGKPASCSDCHQGYARPLARFKSK